MPDELPASVLSDTSNVRSPSCSPDPLSMKNDGTALDSPVNVYALHEDSDRLSPGPTTPGKRVRESVTTPTGHTPQRSRAANWLDKELAAIALYEDVEEELALELATKPAKSPEMLLTCRVEQRPLAGIARSAAAAADAATVRRSALGIWIVSGEEASVIVAEVEPNSCAARGGLRAGDAIRKIGGVVVCNKEEAKAVLARVWRGAEQRSSQAHPPDAPDLHAPVDFEVLRSRHGRLPEGWRQRVGEGGYMEFFYERRDTDGKIVGYQRSSRNGRDHPAIYGSWGADGPPPPPKARSEARYER